MFGMVRTSLGDLHGWYYAAVDTESEARRITTERRHGETVIGAKRVKNVDRVPGLSPCAYRRLLGSPNFLVSHRVGFSVFAHRGFPVAPAPIPAPRYHGSHVDEGQSASLAMNRSQVLKWGALGPAFHQNDLNNYGQNENSTDKANGVVIDKASGVDRIRAFLHRGAAMCFLIFYGRTFRKKK
jgi:hypothetical protein